MRKLRVVLVALVAVVVVSCGVSGGTEVATDEGATTAPDKTTKPDADEPDEPTTTERATTTEAPTTTEPSAAGESKDDPLPVGEAAEVGDYTVRITTVDLDATDRVLQLNQFNEPPTNGRYVVFTYDATYNGTDEGTPWIDLRFALSGGDSRQYDTFDCGAVVAGDDFGVTLEPGGTATGVECFDVPPEAIEGGALFVEESMSFEDDARVYWSLS